MPPVAKIRIGVGEASRQALIDAATVVPAEAPRAESGPKSRLLALAAVLSRASVSSSLIIQSDSQRSIDHRDHRRSCPGVSDGLIQKLDGLEIQRRVLSVPCWRAADQFGDPTICPQAARCGLAIARKTMGQYRGLKPDDGSALG